MHVGRGSLRDVHVGVEQGALQQVEHGGVVDAAGVGPSGSLFGGGDGVVSASLRLCSLGLSSCSTPVIAGAIVVGLLPQICEPLVVSRLVGGVLRDIDTHSGQACRRSPRRHHWVCRDG